MAGVVVTTEARVGQAQPLSAQSGQFFIVGMTERGSVTAPILVKSMTDVESLTGGRVTYGHVYDQLKTFFAEGGRQAWLARVVGATAAAGSLTINDRAASPLPTLKFDAANPGAWSANMTLEIQEGTVANTFKVIVKLNGVPVHDHNNIASPAEAVLRFSNSPYVKVTNLGSATAAPNNNPAVTAATAFPAGDDQRASVVAADYVTALGRFSPDLGTGAVAIPGQANDTAWAGINTHCKTYNRIGLLGDEQATSVTDYLDTANDYDSEYVGLFAPWVVVPDESGGTRTIPPEGYVAAMRSRAHEQVGPWRVPAGAIARANYVMDLETAYSQEQINTLEAGNVSPIRKIAGTIRLYGWSTLAVDRDTWAFLKDRDLLNWMVYEAEHRLEDYVFAPVDARGKLLSDINGALVSMVEPIRAAGGLYENINPTTGETIDPGYIVITDSSVNNTSSLGQNQVAAELRVRVSPTGSLITLRIVKVGVTQGIS